MYVITQITNAVFCWQTLKLPDAIIVAMAREKSAKLVTRDVQLNRIFDLIIVDW